MKSFYSKILEAQKKIGAIKKEQTNPYFKSKYADINDVIEVVKPVMNEVGLVVMQHLVSLDGKTALETMVVDSETGDNIKSVCPLIENTDPQKMGAIITYYRRYALQSILFLAAEDSDGNDTKPEEVRYKPVKQDPIFGNSVTQAPQEEKIDYVEKLTKRVGGTCIDCHSGTYVVSPKTGKTFCDKKCFVKVGRQTPPPNDMDSPF